MQANGRKVHLNWLSQLAECHYHPYSKPVNDYICAFGKLLPAIKSSHVDIPLARLYALSMGADEHCICEDDKFEQAEYKQIYTEHYGDIRKWVYENIAAKVCLVSSLFDPYRLVDKLMRDNERYGDTHENWRLYGRGSYAYGSNVVNARETYKSDFGYTMDLSEVTRTYIFELIRDLHHHEIQLLDREYLTKLQYALEKIYMSLHQDGLRHELNYFDEAYGAPWSLPRPPQNETYLVEDITSELIKLFPKPLEQSPSVATSDAGKKEYDDYLLNYFDEEHCKIYGYLLQILSALRRVKIEGTLRDLTLPIFNTWPEGPMEEDRVADFTGERHENLWIAHLPSYDPRFVVTINDFTHYKFKVKRDVDTSQCSPGFWYLHMAYHIFEENAMAPSADIEAPVAQSKR